MVQNAVGGVLVVLAAVAWTAVAIGFANLLSS